MKNKIDKLVEKLFQTKEIRVLYMRLPYGSIQMKVYDKNYRIIASTCGDDKHIYKTLKLLGE